MRNISKIKLVLAGLLVAVVVGLGGAATRADAYCVSCNVPPDEWCLPHNGSYSPFGWRAVSYAKFNSAWWRCGWVVYQYDARWTFAGLA